MTKTQTGFNTKQNLSGDPQFQSYKNLYFEGVFLGCNDVIIKKHKITEALIMKLAQ